MYVKQRIFNLIRTNQEKIENRHWSQFKMIEAIESQYTGATDIDDDGPTTTVARARTDIITCAREIRDVWNADMEGWM